MKKLINRTNWEHGISSLVVFIIIFLATNLAWVAWIAPIAFFLGREHAQYEYKIGGPGKLVGYEAFAIHKWCLDAKMDLIFPIVFCSLARLIIYIYLGF